ncbi:MAG: MBL fold metallo-hydrolase [Thermodesulfobacteriota bacterium]
MKVEMFALGPLETNSHLAVTGSSAVAVDVGGDPSSMLKYLKKHDVTLTHILLTHLHFDHIYGVRALSDATGAPVLAGADDAYLMESELGRGGFMGFPAVKPFEYQSVGEGELDLAGVRCVALHTPGHTSGSLSYYFPDGGAVFAGDVVFYRSIGRTDFPGGNLQTLLDSVKAKIFSLPPETAIYPGHGPDTTVAAEKLHNPYFSDFTG